MIVIVKNKMVDISDKAFMKMLKNKKMRHKIITDLIILNNIIKTHKNDFDDSMQLRLSSNIIKFKELKNNIKNTFNEIKTTETVEKSLVGTKTYEATASKINNILRGQIIWN